MKPIQTRIFKGYVVDVWRDNRRRLGFAATVRTRGFSRPNVPGGDCWKKTESEAVAGAEDLIRRYGTVSQ